VTKYSWLVAQRCRYTLPDDHVPALAEKGARFTSSGYTR
jgi:hypothetical protein